MPPSFISVKFDSVGRVRHFLLEGVEFEPPLQHGEDVIVVRGKEENYATVKRPVPQIATRSASASGSCVIRRLTEEDITSKLKHQQREREANRLFAMKIKERSLPMKLVRAEQQLVPPRLIFHFTAESRIDFRELVRELAQKFHCRIEMRQIGARDEAKLLGGYGTCGRPLCCTTWLQEFKPVSIKMAKRQSLNLSPSRLSGLCGRLKCCLRYELPNAAGEQFAGCANEGNCSRSAGGCGSDCGSGSCGGCH